MRRRNSINNSSVDARDSASVTPWDAGAGVVRPSLTTSSLGSLVFQHGVGSRAGPANAVFDVGQGAHCEHEAVGQLGTRAIAQGDPPAHDVAAEPLQRVPVHECIMQFHVRHCRGAMPEFF